MKILVTGSQGFIGKNMIEFLQKKRIDVIGVDIEDTFPELDDVTHMIHLGAITSTTYRDVERILKNNLDYSIKLLDLCNKNGIVFQYASSASVYGNLVKFNEDDPVAPQSPYAWSKYLFDRHVKENLHNYAVTIQGFRYFNVYGPYEDHKGDQASPYTKFTDQAKNTKTITLFRNSDLYLRDFVCVEDVCKAHYQMLDIMESGIYNIGTGKAVSFQTVAEEIAKKYHAEIRYIPMPDALVGQYQTYTCADVSKLKKYIDFDFIEIEEYIKNAQR